MAQPTMGPFGADLYSELAPVAKDDILYGWSLLYYLDTLGNQFDEIEGYARDGVNGEPGWSILVDAVRAPHKALPWLGQFVGATVPASMADATARSLIVNHPNFQRGTLASIIFAAQQHLTGTKDVIIIERYLGDAYQLYVATRTAQTANTTQTQNDIMAAKPAGILLTYATLAGQSFSELLSKGTFQNVFTTYATFQAAYTGP